MNHYDRRLFLYRVALTFLVGAVLLLSVELVRWQIVAYKIESRAITTAKLLRRDNEIRCSFGWDFHLSTPSSLERTVQEMEMAALSRIKQDGRYLDSIVQSNHSYQDGLNRSDHSELKASLWKRAFEKYTLNAPMPRNIPDAVLVTGGIKIGSVLPSDVPIVEKYLGYSISAEFAPNGDISVMMPLDVALTQVRILEDSEKHGYAFHLRKADDR